jgi:transketolase
MGQATSDALAEQRLMARAIRRWVIERSLAAEVGHIGSALSIAEMIAITWGKLLRNPATDDPERDRFILAKGHAALALYAALRWRGLIDDEIFGGFCADGSSYAVHPEYGQPGVEVVRARSDRGSPWGAAWPGRCAGEGARAGCSS